MEWNSLRPLPRSDLPGQSEHVDQRLVPWRRDQPVSIRTPDQNARTTDRYCGLPVDIPKESNPGKQGILAGTWSRTLQSGITPRRRRQEGVNLLQGIGRLVSHSGVLQKRDVTTPYSTCLFGPPCMLMGFHARPKRFLQLHCERCRLTVS